MRQSTRKRKALERQPSTAVAALPLSATERESRTAHLLQCKAASRTTRVVINDMPDRYLTTGQPAQAVRRLSTGTAVRLLSPSAIGPAFISVDIERTETTETTKSFERVIHLRGVSQKTFNLMTGRTVSGPKLYDGIQLDRKLSMRASSPSEASENYDRNYASRMLVRTRKSRILAQRPASSSSIELPSAYQLAQAGIDFDYRVAKYEVIPIERSSIHPNDALLTAHHENAARKAATVLTGRSARKADRKRVAYLATARGRYYAERHCLRLAARIALTERMIRGPQPHRLLLTA